MASNKTTSLSGSTTNSSENGSKTVSFIMYDHNNPNPEKRSVACKECRRTHTKCSPYYGDKARPCARCYLSKIPCEEPEENARKRRHKDISPSTSSLSSSSSSETATTISQLSSPTLSTSSQSIEISQENEKSSSHKRFKLENLLAEASSPNHAPTISISNHSSSSQASSLPRQIISSTTSGSPVRTPILPAFKDLFQSNIPSLSGGNASAPALRQLSFPPLHSPTPPPKSNPSLDTSTSSQKQLH